MVRDVPLSSLPTCTVDGGPWYPVFSLLRCTLETPPPLSKINRPTFSLFDVIERGPFFFFLKAGTRTFLVTWAHRKRLSLFFVRFFCERALLGGKSFP